MKSVYALLLVVASLTAAGVDAGAVVPPRDCGTLRVGGKRYNVKADQLRCRSAREYARRHLASRRRPRAVFWVGLVFASALFGNLFAAFSPWARSGACGRA